VEPARARQALRPAATSPRPNFPRELIKYLVDGYADSAPFLS
jgi:hypothetical protein